MSYDFVAQLSQVTSLVMFIAMFGAVIGYVLWPSNQSRFDRVQRQALDLGPTVRTDSTNGK